MKPPSRRTWSEGVFAARAVRRGSGPGADAVHQGSAFAAEHNGQGASHVTGRVVQVGVAYPGGVDPHQHLAAAGLPELHVFDH